MTRGFSIYLDGLRFAAALIVMLSHFAYPRFTEGRWIWVRELNLGSDAVIVFFVLSGLVIAHVVSVKPGGIGRFAFDRATRLWSVALPALVIGFFLDRLGVGLAPTLYDGWQYNALPLWEVLLRGLSFSNEWGGMATRLGTNGPFWSLSYEAAFYALFAVAFYTTGVRRLVLLAAGVALFGLNILLLMPAWLMGVWLYRRITAEAEMTRPVALRLAVLPGVAYGLCLAIGLPDLLAELTDPLHQALGLRFSDEFLWNGLLGLMVTAHLLGMARLLAAWEGVRVAAPAAWLAGGSFSLYLMHYPLLQFLGGLPLPGASWAGDTVLFGLTFVLCYAFAAAFERPLHHWRAGLRRVLRVPYKSEPSITRTA